MTLIENITHFFPDLKRKLRTAGMEKKPEDFVKESLKNAFFVAFCMAILTFFFVSKNKSSKVWILISFLGFFSVIFYVMIRRVDAKIIQRGKDIDKDVLFAGRFLLVKLNAGRPLINSMVDASRSYGVGSRYFKEIIRDIELGTPLEEALQNAVEYSPSQKFKKILFQISNALKIGIDVSRSLEATLDEIAEEQIIEIQRYGKKLNSITMFYMLLAIVVPSLGVTLFTIVASLTSLSVGMEMFLTLGFFLVIFQLLFIVMFRAIRPNVNI